MQTDTQDKLTGKISAAALLHKLLPMLAVTLAASLLLTFTAGDPVAGYTSDDAVYLLLADLYTFAEPARLPVYAVIREQALFPPLFPILLGLLGGGSASPATAAMISTGLLVISLLIAGRWHRQQTGSSLLAAMLTMMLLLLPGTLVLAQEIWSEFLFMLLLYGIFLLAGRDVPLKHHWTILAILIALATLTRTAGVALLPPFWLLLWRHGARPYWLPAAISTLPFLVWYTARELLRQVNGYTNTLAAGVAGIEPEMWPGLLLDKLIAMFDSLHWLFACIDSGTVHAWATRIVLLALIAAAARAWWQRCLALRLDALFCLVYAVIVIVWPHDEVYFVSRFLYPVVPVLLLYAGIGLAGFRIMRPALPIVTITCLVAALVITGPSLLQLAQRAHAGVPDELKPYRRDRSWLLAAEADPAVLRNSRFIIETLQTLPDRIPEDECILTVQAPLVMLHTKRVAGVLPPPDSTNEQFRSATAACRYILALPITIAARSIPDYYPMQRLRASEYEQASFHADPEAGYGTAIYLLRRIADTIVVE